MKTKTIAIIPARGGSKRLPNKNILTLGTIPLIAHSILFAQQFTDVIDEIYVSTNDAAIKEVAIQYGAKVIDRPEAISGDREPTITSLQHALRVVEDPIENVVLLQATNPLRPLDLFKNAFNCFQDNKCNSLFTVSRNHNKLGKIVNHQFVPFNYQIGQRSQDLEPLYFENGLLYITKAMDIQKGKIITENAFPFIVDHPFANIDIDTLDDFEYAAYLFNKTNNKNI